MKENVSGCFFSEHSVYDKIQDGRWWPYWKLTRKHG